MARERWPGLDLRTAFLGHAPPSLPQVLSTVDADREVTVLPLLLTAAYHSKADIPRMLARLPRPRVSYGATLGPHPLLLRALERRLAEADPSAFQNPARTAVVLAAAGSATRRQTPPSRDWRRSGRPGADGGRSSQPSPRPPSPPPRRR